MEYLLSVTVYKVLLQALGHSRGSVYPLLVLSLQMGMCEVEEVRER